MTVEIYGVPLETLAILGVAVTAFAIWALKKYKAVSADGKLTLDEAISTLEEGAVASKEVAEAAEDVKEELDLDAPVVEVK